MSTRFTSCLLHAVQGAASSVGSGRARVRGPATHVTRSPLTSAGHFLDYFSSVHIAAAAPPRTDTVRASLGGDEEVKSRRRRYFQKLRNATTQHTRDMAALEREDPTDPESWSMQATTASSLESRCVAALRSQGIPATGVTLDPTKLKGGYST